jgi:hypothetical protein
LYKITIHENGPARFNALPKGNSDKIRISITIDTDLHEWTQQHLRKNGQTFSGWISKRVKEFIESNHATK